MEILDHIKNFIKEKYLFLIIIFLIILSFLIPQIETFLHIVLNFFAGGRNSIRVYLYLFYLLILLILIYKFKKDKVLKLSKSFWIISFIIGLIGFILNWYIFQLADVSLDNFLIYFSGDEITSTKFVHNHILKVLIGSIAVIFGFSNFENLDPGLVFVEMIPVSVVLLVFVLFVSLFYITLKNFIFLFHKYQNRKTLFFFLYSILSFIILKSLIDGGFLHQSIAPAAFFLFLIYDYKNKIKNVHIYILSLMPFVLTVIYYVLGFYNSYDEFKTVIFGQLALILFFIPFVYLLKKQEKGIDRIFVLTLINGLLLFTYTIFSSLYALNYYKIEIEDNAFLLAYNVQDNENVVAEINNLKLLEISNENFKTVGDVLNEYDILGNFHPVSVPWKTCIPTSNFETFEFDLLIDSEIKDQDIKFSSEFYNYEIILNQEYENKYLYKVSLKLHPCLTRPINIIDEIFSQYSDQFFVYNLKID